MHVKGIPCEVGLRGSTTIDRMEYMTVANEVYENEGGDVWSIAYEEKDYIVWQNGFYFKVQEQRDFTIYES